MEIEKMKELCDGTDKLYKEKKDGCDTYSIKLTENYLKELQKHIKSCEKTLEGKTK